MTEIVEEIARAIGDSLWGDAQAVTFFELRERNVHFGRAMDAARAAYEVMARSDGVGQRNIALAALYKVAPAMAARLCDEEFDPSGKLLGEVREIVRLHTLHHKGTAT